MPRNKVIRTLPPIEEVFAAHGNFPNGQTHRGRLQEALRAACEQLRRAEPQAFYSMREIASFFEAPLRTVALVYGDLEKEGILNRIRGSQTMLMGKENVPRHPVRGVIGIPIWLDGLILSSFTRSINMELEELLRARGFVADMIFHVTKREEGDPDFSERLLNHQLDAVFWQNPLPQSYPNILTLRERGTRVLIIQTMEAETVNPAITYLQDWSAGYHQLAQRWREAGIREVLLPFNPDNLSYKSESAILANILASSGLSPKFCPPDLASLPKPRSPDSAKRQGIAFMEIPTADLFFNQEPSGAQELARFCRVASCRGPVRSPYLQRHGVELEVVGFSAKEMATKIAEDIQRLPMLADGIRHTFKAKYWESGQSDDMSGHSGLG